ARRGNSRNDQARLDPTAMTARFLAIVNPAAGGGRCGKQAPKALARLSEGGIALEVRETRKPGDAVELARTAWREGFRNFLAVGGDGTSFEIVNGLFPEALQGPRPVLGLLPLGTGNSFLRDFSSRGAEHAIEAVLGGEAKACDIVRLSHATGEIYF